MSDYPLIPGPSRGGEVAPRQYPDAIPYAPTEPNQDDGLIHYLRILQRHKGLLLICAVLGALAALLIVLPQTPVFQAKVSVEIQGLNDEFLNLKNFNPTSNANYDPSYEIQTQVKVLESRTLLSRVMEKLSVNRTSLVTGTDRLSAWRTALHLPSANSIPATDALRMAAGNIKVKPSVN